MAGSTLVRKEVLAGKSNHFHWCEFHIFNPRDSTRDSFLMTACFYSIKGRDYWVVGEVMLMASLVLLLRSRENKSFPVASCNAVLLFLSHYQLLRSLLIKRNLSCSRGQYGIISDICKLGIHSTCMDSHNLIKKFF